MQHSATISSRLRCSRYALCGRSPPQQHILTQRCICASPAVCIAALSLVLSDMVSTTLLQPWPPSPLVCAAATMPCAAAHRSSLRTPSALHMSSPCMSCMKQAPLFAFRWRTRSYAMCSNTPHRAPIALSLHRSCNAQWDCLEPHQQLLLSDACALVMLYPSGL